MERWVCYRKQVWFLGLRLDIDGQDSVTAVGNGVI